MKWIYDGTIIIVVKTIRILQCASCKVAFHWSEKLVKQEKRRTGTKVHLLRNTENIPRLETYCVLYVVSLTTYKTQ